MRADHAGCVRMRYMTHPVVAEAIKKAAIAWLTVGDGPALALWCLPLDGALYVVSGPGEQAAPGLADATSVQVTLRGDHGGRIVTWTADAHRLTPGTEEWETVAPQVAAKRLNASGTAESLVQRWVDDGCALVGLVPAESAAMLAGRELPDASEAAPPRDTPARVPVRRPFKLHRVRRPKA
jgi:hypothetical protein